MEETTMTTTDKNKLIAEFMGYIDNGCSEDGFLIHPETNYDIDVSELQYHSSYDWIMPVVERIEEIGFHVDIFMKAVSIHGEELIIDLNGNNYSSKLEAIHNAVVDFIMWYNLNKEEK